MAESDRESPCEDRFLAVDEISSALEHAAAMMRGIQSDVAHHTNLSPEIDACCVAQDALDRLRAVAEAAADFVATTSYFRQTKASRPEFEKLAVALIVLRRGE